MAWDDDKSTAADPDNPEPDEQLTADEWDAHVQDQKNHKDRHGYEGSDELATALKYDPESEPNTPADGCVRWYDETDDAYKVKFSDGNSITVGEL